tara:strand:- start:259 stop:561 length:303 start_codon:yes stop_codon:yes gene_type:complete
MGQCCTKRSKENNNFEKYAKIISTKKKNYKIEKYKNKKIFSIFNSILYGTSFILFVGVIISGTVTIPVVITLFISGVTFVYYSIKSINYSNKIYILKNKK